MGSNVTPPSQSTAPSNIVVQDNIYWANGWDRDDGDISGAYGGLQFNGRCDGCFFRGNISHSNSSWGFSLVQGVRNSTVANNLIFNNGGYGIVFNLYSGGSQVSCEAFGGDPTWGICPYSTNNNLVINNTIWTGKFVVDGRHGAGTYPDITGAFGIFNNSLLCAGDGMVVLPASSCTGEQIFRNNVIIHGGHSGSQPWFFWNPEPGALSTQSWAENSVFENNIVFRQTAGTTMLAITVCTHPTNCAFGQTKTDYNFAAFNAAPFGNGSNASGNPLVTSADINDYATPALFNFNLLTASPAINIGTSTGAPSVDIRGAPRMGNPDAGAYEFTIPPP
jgi:hypothetical protein